MSHLSFISEFFADRCWSIPFGIYKGAKGNFYTSVCVSLALHDNRVWQECVCVTESNYQSLALAVILNFSTLKNAFFTFSIKWAWLAISFFLPGPSQMQAFFHNEIGLEVTFKTTLQNRKPQLPCQWVLPHQRTSSTYICIGVTVCDSNTVTQVKCYIYIRLLSYKYDNRRWLSPESFQLSVSAD